MRKTYGVAVLALALATVWSSGCGGPKNTTLTPSPSKKVIEDIPDWFTDLPEEDDRLFDAASATSRDLQVAIKKATADARLGLAGQLGTYLANHTKNFQEEVGLQEDSALLTQFSSATKEVVEQTLVGSKAERQEVLPEGNIYRVYVLMSLPLGEANQALMERIKANDELYTRFRATEAFADLERELGRDE